MRRRHLTAALVLLLAAPAFAQTGDCPGPSQTSWEWFGVQAESGELCFNWYAAGLANESQNCRPEGFPAGTDLTALAVSKCADREADRNENEFNAATVLTCDLLFAEPNPELIVPSYPEIVTTDSNAPTADEARQRAWHRRLIRDKWGQPTSEFSNCVLNLWQWVNTQQTTPGRRTWWDLVVSQDNEANQRLGSLAGAESILSQDAEYFGTDIEDF